MWNPGGSLLATESGGVTVAALGDRIAWGRARIVESPIDIWSPGGVTLEGRHLPGRIRLSARNGRLQAVSVVPMEEYVAAVVSREASPSFLPEALSALAVAVRTYTLVAMASPRDPDYDVVAGVEDQVFEGVEGVGGAFRDAVEATRGEALHYQGGLARTVYHSTCGGRTESAADAWGKDVPYLRPVECDDCRDSPAWRWEYRMGTQEGRRISLELGIRGGEDLRIEITGRTSTGRASRVRFSSGGAAREAKAALFRKAAGYARVRSLRMEIVPVAGGWRITGGGYGHGVGMCQWGSNGMARKGSGYREILSRYYPATRVAARPEADRPAFRAAGGNP